MTLMNTFYNSIATTFSAFNNRGVPGFYSIYLQTMFILIIHHWISVMNE